ncbi:serine kinase [Paenibacillus sp. IHB B 3084]|uniref:dephospho-CoA kinase n=1 Tax=Paenibacillus sp. IHB B 3084 TaxID=867076 RepID=UPI0007223284|nr:dephospho-CoA kinase [Paenibacillus sp. IHB B 3084]ALP35729.1 serine kinase [Paenibacillus sp. IHB B 3084]
MHDSSTRSISLEVYTAFGLKIASELELPELIPAASGVVEDVVIRQADLTEWSEQLEQTHFMIEGESFMFHVPGTAIYAVRGGKEVEVYVYHGADPDTVRLFVLGTCMGVLLLQRRILPLHGSAVVIGGKAYAFVGESGAGKSTLAAAFTQAGYKIVSDDVIAVQATAFKTIVYPAYPQQKLGLESMLQLEALQENKHGRKTNHGLILMDGNPAMPKHGHLRKLTGELNKYALPTVDSFHNEPLPLGGVFELVAESPKREFQREGELKAVIEHSLNMLECLHTLLFHTYRRVVIPRMSLGEWHFRTVARVARQVEGWRLLRDSSAFTASEIVHRVLDIIRKEENSYGS